MNKKILELYYSIQIGKLKRDDAAGLLNMRGYPVTENKKGRIIGRFPFRLKDGEMALNHAVIIKGIAREMKAPSVVFVGVIK